MYSSRFFFEAVQRPQNERKKIAIAKKKHKALKIVSYHINRQRIFLKYYYSKEKSFEKGNEILVIFSLLFYEYLKEETRFHQLGNRLDKI